MKPRICHGMTKYFLTAFQISFETRQHMEAYLVAAASACSVNLCQLTEITCLSPALKFTYTKCILSISPTAELEPPASA